MNETGIAILIVITAALVVAVMMIVVIDGEGNAEDSAIAILLQQNHDDLDELADDLETRHSMNATSFADMRTAVATGRIACSLLTPADLTGNNATRVAEACP